MANPIQFHSSPYKVSQPLDRYQGGAAESIGADYLDYNVDGIIEECGLNWQTDFYDDHHANAGRSIKQTDCLVKYVQDKASEISDSTRKQFEQEL